MMYWKQIYLTQIPKLTNIISISVGNYNSFCLASNGKVYAFGSDYYGQLGLNDTLDRLTPTIIPYLNNISKKIPYFFFNK